MRSIIALCLVGHAFSEESSLLQVEVDAEQSVSFALKNIGQQVEDLNIPGKANRLAINALMKKVASSSKITQETRDTLQNVSDLLADPILTSLAAEKATKETELGQVVTDVTACNSDGVAADTEEQGKIDPARQAHLTCRTEQLADISSADSVCDDAEGHMGDLKFTVETKCVFEDQSEATRPYPAGFTQAIADYTTALGALKAAYKDANDNLQDLLDCQSETAALGPKNDECNTKQDNFELAYCNAKQSRDILCSTRTECHANATTDNTNRWATIEPLSTQRAKEACLIMHVICLIDKLVLEDSVDLTACDGNGTDYLTCMTEYGNEIPDVPAADPCVLITGYPGEVGGNFRQTEYDLATPNLTDLVKATTAC